MPKRPRIGDSYPELDDGRQRVVIEGLQPEVDGGRFPIKRVMGDRRSLYQSMRSLATQILQLLRNQLKGLAEVDLELTNAVLDREAESIARFRTLADRPVATARIRCHSDYHLGQVLYAGAAFLREYLSGVESADLLPRAQEDVRVLLDALLLDKAIYELGYELNNRPDWVRIPLDGILQLLEAPA